jgi:hypothetical protein
VLKVAARLASTEVRKMPSARFLKKALRVMMAGLGRPALG